MRLITNAWRCTAALLMVATLASAAHGGEWHTRVVLDPSTFPKTSRPQLSHTADEVAREIDHLIPGKPVWNAAPRLLCFVSPADWVDKPLVVIGQRHVGEPRSVRANTVRIAVRSSVLPNAYQRFAFQLAHELAHVKMDPRLDNEVVETFAVAVSFEIMDRLGYRDYVETNEHYYAQSLPKQVQDAIAKRDLDSLRAYLRYRWRAGAARPPDYSLQLVGAAILRADGKFPWHALLGIGVKGTCPLDATQTGAKICPLNTDALPALKISLNRIGIVNDRVLVRRVSTSKPTDQVFTFEENGIWVSLLEIESGKNAPAGFR